MDLCKRLIKENIKLYAMDQITFEHYGGQSHDKKYNHEAQLSRNWHYNWSKFYYINKHNNYFYALRKISPNLIKAIKKYIYRVVNIKKRLIQQRCQNWMPALQTCRSRRCCGGLPSACLTICLRIRCRLSGSTHGEKSCL